MDSDLGRPPLRGPGHVFGSAPFIGPRRGEFCAGVAEAPPEIAEPVASPKPKKRKLKMKLKPKKTPREAKNLVKWG